MMILKEIIGMDMVMNYERNKMITKNTIDDEVQERTYDIFKYYQKGNLECLEKIIDEFTPKIKEGVIDLGLKSITKGTRFPAVIKGIADSGIKTYYSEKIFPDEGQISGQTIAKFSKNLKQTSPELYKKQFSKYLKEGFSPEDLPINFKKVKDKINGEQAKNDEQE